MSSPPVVLAHGVTATVCVVLTLTREAERRCLVIVVAMISVIRIPMIMTSVTPMTPMTSMISMISVAPVMVTMVHLNTVEESAQRVGGVGEGAGVVEGRRVRTVYCLVLEAWCWPATVTARRAMRVRAGRAGTRPWLGSWAGTGAWTGAWWMGSVMASLATMTFAAVPFKSVVVGDARTGFSQGRCDH